MIRKDYELLAKVLRYTEPSRVAKPLHYKARYEAWENVRFILANTLAIENKNFDRAKFILKSINAV
jgi:hypothetical protein